MREKLFTILCIAGFSLFSLGALSEVANAVLFWKSCHPSAEHKWVSPLVFIPAILEIVGFLLLTLAYRVPTIVCVAFVLLFIVVHDALLKGIYANAPDILSSEGRSAERL